ncbi:unnamed protein product [Paramecium primaurelia]|uniref:Uncharacterized protein n=1 Tax=Paramecium primaurelia TaxID=5886 RepID=A0A8S1MXQ5_PARPR|nr:unnamed protein product [Paramecium primaurelia]
MTLIKVTIYQKSILILFNTFLREYQKKKRLSNCQNFQFPLLVMSDQFASLMELNQ